MKDPKVGSIEPGFSQDTAFMGELERMLGKNNAITLITVLDAEFERSQRDAFLCGFKLATLWVAGPKWADVVIAFLSGAKDRSDGEIAAELGVTKQAVGKLRRKLQKNAGMPLHAPQCSNGKKIGVALTKKKKAKSEKQKDVQ